MAENEEGKSEEEEEETKNSEEEEQKKHFPKKIIIISLLLLFLAGGGLFVWKSGFLNNSSDIKDNQDVSEEITDEGKGKVNIGPIFTMSTFIVNLAGDLGKKYLKVKLEMELNGKELKMEIEQRLPQFRDTILTILSGKTYEDVSSLEGKYQLRAELISMLNQHLKTGKITSIYFTEFIVQ